MNPFEELYQTVEKEQPALFAQLLPAASPKAIEDFEKTLALSLPDDFKELYLLFNGFAPHTYLYDGLRLLPLNEIIEQTQHIKGSPIVTYEMAGEFFIANKKQNNLLIIALYEPSNPDIAWVGLKLSQSKKTQKISGKICLMYKEGGIHDFEEMVSIGETFGEWIESLEMVLKDL
jgi:cell wall assembly regulator SMI1